MTIPAPPPGLQPEDYEEIEAAVMETARGRWFLSEYARRARRGEGDELLAALERIEARLEAKGALAPQETFSVAERLSELSWTLRERGVEDFVCGKIDALAREFARGAKLRPKRKTEPAPALAADSPQAPPPPPPQEAAVAAPSVAQDNIVERSAVAASPPREDCAAETAAPQPAPGQPADAAVAPAPHSVASAHAPERWTPEVIDDAPEPPPSPPVDPRLAALSWLDRLPLVDRMALFA